jgi:hypothetical protein
MNIWFVSMGNIYPPQKKFWSFLIKANKVYITIQVSEPSNCYL